MSKLKDIGRGSKVNVSGVKFTKTEQETIKKLVQRAKATERYHQKKAAALKPPSFLPEPKKPSAARYRPKAISANLSKFDSKQEFKKYLKYLEKRASLPTRRLQQYAENMVTAIKKTEYVSKQKRYVINLIRGLTNNQIEVLINRHSDIFSQGYVYYDPEDDKLLELANIIELVKSVHK